MQLQLGAIYGCQRESLTWKRACVSVLFPLTFHMYCQDVIHTPIHTPFEASPSVQVMLMIEVWKEFCEWRLQLCTVSRLHHFLLIPAEQCRENARKAIKQLQALVPNQYLDQLEMMQVLCSPVGSCGFASITGIRTVGMPCST